MNPLSIHRIVFSSIFLLFLFTNSNSFAQNSTLDFNNYTPLEAKGKIPKDFLKKMSEYYAEKRVNNNDTGDKNTEKSKDKFDVMASFHLKRLLLSGSVLFGDTVSVYVQKVGDKILENYPDLQGKIRFYVTKEHTVNAFSTPEGFIFINIGLLAHLENEAQLAYILSHEVTHFVKKHSINQFLYEQEIERESSKKGVAGWFSKSKSLYEKQAEKSSYSKEQEIEADDYGWEIFSKTGYDLSEMMGAFRALESSLYPFDTLVFKSKFLNNSFVDLPDGFYYKDTLHFVEMPKLTKEELEKLRALQTHPDIEERQKIALARIDLNNDKKGEKYLISEEDFNLVQKIARFEMCELYLNENLFLDAIYHALILESKYGKSNYSEFSLVKALYGMADYDLYGRRIYLEFPYNEIDWKGRNWFFALEELSDKQLGVLAASHLIELSKKDKKYEYLKPYYLDLLEKSASKKSEKFFDRNEYSLSIKETVEEIPVYNTDIMYKSWVKIKNSLDSTDMAYLKEQQNVIAKKKQEDKYVNKLTEENNPRDVALLGGINKQGKLELPKLDTDFNFNLSDIAISNALMIRPFAISFYDEENEAISLAKTDQLQRQIIEAITNLKDTINVKYLDFSTFTQDDVEKYNDLVFLQSWFVKTYSLEEQLMPFYYEEKIKSLASKYGVSNFVMSVFLSTNKTQVVLLRSQNKESTLKKERDKIVEGSYIDWEQHLLELLSKQK